MLHPQAARPSTAENEKIKLKMLMV